MQRLTETVLRHRRAVALAWIALTVVGVLMVGSANSGLAYSQATPGQPGYDANAAMIKRLGLDGNEQPVFAVLRLPPGEGMRTSAGRALAASTFAAAHRAGHLGLADYANTGNPTLISRDGQTTWALIDMPNPDVGPYTAVHELLEPALKAATPPGAKLTLTGFEALQSSGAGSGGGGGPSVLVETLIGGEGRS
jgi:RND superfamily putative drug exporter